MTKIIRIDKSDIKAMARNGGVVMFIVGYKPFVATPEDLLIDLERIEEYKYKEKIDDKEKRNLL